MAEIHDVLSEYMRFKKVALLKYYAKLIHHDAEQWHDWTVDISRTHRVLKAGYSKLLLGMLQLIHTFRDPVRE